MVLQPKGAMASIPVRNLYDDVKRRLCVRASEHGRSVEEKVRDILRQVVGQPSAPKNLSQSIHQRLAALGGVDLALPARTPMRASPDFE
jgi:plasmid stability protein